MNVPNSSIIEYDVIALHEFSSGAYPDLTQEVYKCLDSFACSRSSHLQSFARHNVRRYEDHGHSRTYVFITSKGDSIDVPAFFTLGMTYLDYSNKSTSRKRKLSGSISVERTGAYALAELARSDAYTSEQLPGSVILDEAKQVICEARQLIGGRFLVVDSRREVFEALYKPAGFTELDIAESPLGMEDIDFVTSCCLIKDWQ